VLFRWSEALQFEALTTEEELESTYQICLLLPRKIEARCFSEICTPIRLYVVMEETFIAIEIYISYTRTFESILFLSQNVM
jgi:hypothetical protein